MHEAVVMYEECYTDTALARESATVFTLTFPTVDLSTYQWPQPHWLPHISCVVWNDTNYKASVETYTYRQTLISHMTCGGVGAWSSSLQVRWKLRWRIVRVSKYTWTLCNWKLNETWSWKILLVFNSILVLLLFLISRVKLILHFEFSVHIIYPNMG